MRNMKNEKEIREKFNELRDSFLKSKIKEIRKDLYRRENKKKIATPEIKEIEENLELEKNLPKLKWYYDHDDIEHKGIRDVGNLFDLSTDEDYYKPKIVNSALITIILNIKVKEIKTKFYQIKNILI